MDRRTQLRRRYVAGVVFRGQIFRIELRKASSIPADVALQIILARAVGEYARARSR